jgi:hypothetical protein
MKHSRHFWRGLFFILLITVLCGGMAAPAGNVRAAPQRQAAIDLVISEFRFRGSGGGADEFIEIYNPTTSTINLNGWQIRGSNNSGSSGPRYTFSQDVFLYSGQHYLISHTSYNDSVTPNATYGSGITDDGGIALVRPDSSIADQVGLSSGSLYKEGTILTSLTANTDQSYERSLGGLSDSCVDNDDNSTDFLLINPSNPQNASSPLSLCGVILPTPTPTGTATDTGTPTSTGTPTTSTGTPTATSPSTGSATNVVISEFRTSAGSGAATNEYIELYNPTSNWIDISGWKINASNSSGDVQTRATVPASTILRPGQYYLVAHTGYVVIDSVSANLTYGTGITDNGGIALLTSSDQIIDEVGMDKGSAYWETDPLSPLSSANRSYERKAGDPSGSCVDTNNNLNDFTDVQPSPHNYSTIRLCNGASGPGVSNTATNITADAPDPSLVNGNVIVSVSVTGGSTTPSGKVNITGANTNCTITLSASGTGSCTVKFTSTGSKTITATYLGDNTHWNSSDTEPHQVTTTSGIGRTPTPTRPATPLPPPPLIGINEFVPRPGHDWNNDGVINTNDEYIELINHGVIDVNLSGYSLDDEVNIGSSPFSLPSITLKPGERRVFYGSETGLLLSDGGDGVRLLKPNGQLGDAYNYSVVRFPDQSYCRLPDNGGLDDWNQNCFPTPGLQNSQSASSVNPPTSGDAENLCPVADTLPLDFVLAECLPFGNNIYNPAYWDQFGWFDERHLPESTGKWPVFVD